MNVFKHKKKLMLGLVIIMVLCPYTISKAQSASITISSDNNEVAIGEEVLVKVQLTSKALLGDFEAYFSYDPEILEFKNDASFIAGGEGLLKLSDINVINQDYSRKYVMKFIAKDIGISEIGIKDRAVIYDYETGEEMSISSNRVSMQVIANHEVSNNNDLKSLKISPGTLIPEFHKDTTEYSVEVASDVNQLILSSTAEDENATVTIEGNDALKAGVNEITVIVKAQSGDVKTYKLMVTKETDRTSNDEDIKDDVKQTTDNDEYNSIGGDTAIINHMVIMKDNNGIYIQNGIRYKVIDLKDETLIPMNYIKTTIILNGVSINAYTRNDYTDNEFFLIYAKNESGKEGFYQFDRVENTIQRYTKNQDENYVNNKIDYSTELNETQNSILVLVIIIGILLIIAIMFLSIAIHNKVSKKSSKFYKMNDKD